MAGIPGGEPEVPRRPARTWLELGSAVVLAGLLALTGLGFLLNAVGPQPPHAGTRLGQALGAVVSIGLLVLATRWAIRIEHRLRAHQPLAQTFAAGPVAAPLTGPEPAGSPADPRRDQEGHARRRRRRHYGPGVTAASVALFAAGTLGCVVGAISMHQQGVRSAYVQKHGTRASAVVESVDNTEHCSRSGCSYTAAIAVTLSPPVDGASDTVVHYPGFSYLATGEHVIVLVDPKQPGYAELPGSRFVASWAWIGLLVLAAFLAWLTFADARGLRTLLAHRRQQQRTAVPASPPLVPGH